jgi:hypothetical protein
MSAKTDTFPLERYGRVSDSNGNPTPELNTWLSSQHTTAMRGLEIQIPNIELMQAEMSPSDRLMLFGYSGLPRSCNGSSESTSTMKSEVDKFYQSLEESVCTTSPSQMMRASAMRSLPLYAKNSTAVFEAWRKLDKKVFGVQTHLLSREYSFADVCSLMQAGDQK